MSIVRWYIAVGLCTCPVLVRYGVVVNPCRDQSEPVCGALASGRGSRDARGVAQLEAGLNVCSAPVQPNKRRVARLVTGTL